MCCSDVDRHTRLADSVIAEFAKPADAIALTALLKSCRELIARAASKNDGSELSKGKAGVEQEPRADTSVGKRLGEKR